jgi:CRISPR-associated exonuclease Cas4
MFSEDDLLPLSGLQHFTFCERRWALVQIERQWEDNRFTAEGEAAHERTHSGEIESRPDVLIRRAVPLLSLRLGLSGIADVVEFHRAREGDTGVAIAGKRGLWKPHPIEYKRKRGKGKFSAYDVQLCGQAICLEEFFGIAIDLGFILDITAKRRRSVHFTPALRSLVDAAASRMRTLLAEGRTPLPVLKKACPNCSLYERCQPGPIGNHRSVHRYLKIAFSRLEETI